MLKVPGSNPALKQIHYLLCFIGLQSTLRSRDRPEAHPASIKPGPNRVYISCKGYPCIASFQFRNDTEQHALFQDSFLVRPGSGLHPGIPRRGS
ncbi:unnamed protein product [Nezara viridula]|uniref:Uncharacterized protein n=1 Tax=Nezara viridula TaxID=85310 RepID=A0A9P0MUD7_NEZVI|nr:unnamed protein product [Nezara viridula]